MKWAVNKVDAFEEVVKDTKNNLGISPAIVDIIFDIDYTAEDKYYEVYILLRKSGFTKREQVIEMTEKFLGLPAYEVPEEPPVDPPVDPS